MALFKVLATLCAHERWNSVLGPSMRLRESGLDSLNLDLIVNRKTSFHVTHPPLSGEGESMRLLFNLDVIGRSSLPTN